MSNENVADNIIKAIIGHGAIHRAGYDEGVKAERRKALAKLDEAWAEINAEGGAEGIADDEYSRGYDRGVIATVNRALEIIGKLGGMDPAKRKNEND